MRHFIILLLFATMVFGLPKLRSYKRTQQGDSVDKASMKILKESFENAKDKNVIASPLGVLTLLSMFSAGTEGRSKEEIMQLLGFTNYKQLEDYYGYLSAKFRSRDSYMVLANKIYVSHNYTLNDHFSDVATRTYRSEVEQVDFAQKKATVDSINKWANEKSKGHIKSPVNEQTINERDAVALFNIIFFQGHWNVPFNASKTEEKDFYVTETETVKKPMMKLTRTLFYYEDAEIGARMVELPYKEDGFRMIVVLPDEKDGLAEVVEKLAQKGILEDVFALRPTRREVAFEMPKFEIKNNLDLNEILPKVGVGSILSEGAQEVVLEQPVVVSKAFQEAFVKVDEEGATAGAFTGFLLVPISASYKHPPPLQFKVDRPFMFAILHMDIVLFTGTYTH